MASICDLCGTHCQPVELVQLLQQYQTAGVVDVCPACEKWANKTKGDLLLEIGPRMRAAIEQRKGAAPVVVRAASDPWWRRGLRALGSGFSA